MELEVSVPCSQEFSTGPYPYTEESSSYHSFFFLYDPF
jgi:hypothetical protein